MNEAPETESYSAHLQVNRPPNKPVPVLSLQGVIMKKFALLQEDKEF